MMDRSTKACPTCFYPNSVNGIFNQPVKYGSPPCIPPTEAIRVGRVPLAIKQARYLPEPSTLKLFVFNMLIPGSWNPPKGMVTKSYVLSRGDPSQIGPGALLSDS